MVKRITRNLVGAVALALTLFLSHSITAYASTKPEVQAFIEKMQTQHHFTPKETRAILSKAKVDNAILHFFNHPYESKPWHTYKKHFITNNRVKEGKRYMTRHKRSLKAVEKQYGVDPAVIVAIIGVESKYGKEQFKHSVLDALYTLSFFQKTKTHFFRSELENYFLLCKEQQYPPEKLMGSYAGAIGIPQFMPSAFRNTAVSYHKKHKIDLIHSHNDAIASIANYLKKAHWQPHLFVAERIPAKDNKPWMKRSLKQLISTTQIKERVPSMKQLPDKVMVSIIEIGKDHYWVVSQNFRAILRYNPRFNYALAVYQLSESLKRTQ